MARKYRLKRRAEGQEATRRRIVEATVELHGTIGPSHTSIQAIAARAGVERPTVYRHFPTIDELFLACSGHHWSEHPLPDPEPWLDIDASEARLRRGLSEIYAYYLHHEDLLWNVLRDLEDRPDWRRFAGYPARRLERSCEVLARAFPHRGRQQRLVRAALGHVTDFFAWRALRRQGLEELELIELMIGMVRSVPSTRSRRQR